MNYPRAAQELIKWGISNERDSFGTFTVITGYEGTGHCFWCGDDIQGRRRFCGGRKGCWTRYQEYFNWNYAKDMCLKRYQYRCANCGCEGINLYRGEDMINLRAHHIIPLNGEDRAVSVYNVPWNLICLCHNCHLEVHAAMRPPPKAKPSTIDSWEYARRCSQAVMGLEV